LNVKKQQIFLAGGALALLLVLYIFGITNVPKKPTASATGKPPLQDSVSTDFKPFMQTAKAQLTPAQLAYIDGLEASVKRGDVKAQQLKVYKQLAVYWRDSLHTFGPYLYYLAEEAKLENSEKSLTFAANLYLGRLKGEVPPALKPWMAVTARELFEKALQLNPSNDSTKIGLGSTFIFGNNTGDPQQTMEGIRQILEVSRRDSTNMYAQLMLGIGGVYSGQMDKAVSRLQKVVTAQPQNAEAVFALADAYQRMGDAPNAIAWYEKAKAFVSDPAMIKEIDNMIHELGHK
jgi:tetratricopeptide (TPR) repeat protein